MCTSASTVKTTAHRSVSIREFNVIYVIHNHFVNVSKNSFSTKGVSVIARGTHNRQTFSPLISPRQSPQHRHMTALDVETHRLMWTFLHGPILKFCNIWYWAGGLENKTTAWGWVRSNHQDLFIRKHSSKDSSTESSGAWWESWLRPAVS